MTRSHVGWPVGHGSGLVAILCAAYWLCSVPEATLSKERDGVTTAPATVEAVIAATSGVKVVHIGAETLKKGGSAADAVLTVSLAQVAQVAGSYVSYGGILSLMYYDAASGSVHYLNAGFDTPREETEAGSIPLVASGRTALVPGYMAGVEAAHQKFGKLRFARLFDAAIAIAEDGIRIDPDLSAVIRQRKDALTRLPETRRVFTRPDGALYTEGDLFRQPELAKTLRQVADKRARFMYTGDWGKHFVAVVRRLGGKVTLRDMEDYRAVWEEPVQTTYFRHSVYVPRFSSREGVNLVEALNLLEAADLKRRGHYTKSAESLFWLAQILGCQDLMWLPADAARNSLGMDLSFAARVQKQNAQAIWKRMQNGSWRYARTMGRPAGHSDAVVVVDRWGNVASLTHTINTNLWGDTGVFVDGVSIPDPAALQRQQVQEAGPGKRLRDTMGPVIVLRGGKPVLATSAIGSGLHEKTVQLLHNVLAFGTDPQAAADAPYLLPRENGPNGPVVRVIESAFEVKLVEDLQALGQPVRILQKARIGEWGGWCGVLVGVSLDPKTGARQGIPARYSKTVSMPD